ncbi:hypothetical protein R7190_27435, partial [Vibrio sp. 1078-1]|nr:hypothetical protein [Vibrio sp. 1078-1]
MRFIPFALALIAFSSSPSAYELDYYSKFGHIDNYGNLDLRNKPYTELPSGLVIKGNVDISQTPITQLPKGLDVGGSLDAENRALKTLKSGVKIKGYANLLGSKIASWPK